MLLQQPWDFIVLQDYSAMATVRAGRALYMDPAIAACSRVKRAAELVLYLTWGYHDGNERAACPSSDLPSCFPLGSLAALTDPPCNTSAHYHDMTRSFECMGYSVARSYLAAHTTLRGVSRVAPCGLAWQIVRGSTQIPSDCKALVDANYPSPLNLSLPLRAPAGTLPHFMLYRVFNGKTRTTIDKHPNVAGQYLNALVMYATLMRKCLPVPLRRFPLAVPPQATGRSPNMRWRRCSLLRRALLRGVDRHATNGTCAADPMVAAA